MVRTTVITLSIWTDRHEQTVELDQLPQNMVSDQMPHCLPLIQQFLCPATNREGDILILVGHKKELIRFW